MKKIIGPFIVFFEKSKKVIDGFSTLRDAQKYSLDNEKTKNEKLIAMPVDEYNLQYINERKNMKKEITISELKQYIKKIISEEVGLSRKFDGVVAQYKDLMIEKQDLVSDFIKKLKSNKDPDKVNKIKKEYIQRIKSINSKIDSYESKFETAVKNLPDPDDDELL